MAHQGERSLTQVGQGTYQWVPVEHPIFSGANFPQLDLEHPCLSATQQKLLRCSLAEDWLESYHPLYDLSGSITRFEGEKCNWRS